MRQELRESCQGNEAVRPPRKGFTLLELLVVIAVIAILASLLLPALAAAKWHADSAVCKSNLHQMGIAVTMYVGEFDAYPSGEFADSDWRKMLLPYSATRDRIENVSTVAANGNLILRPIQSIYACPGYNRIRGIYSSGGDGAYGYNWCGVGSIKWPSGSVVVLGLSGVYFTPDGKHGPGFARTVRSSEVVTPAEMIATGDTQIAGSLGGAQLPGGLSAPNVAFPVPYPMGAAGITYVDHNDVPFDGVLQRRHGGQWNTVFCDGHVQNLRLEEAHFAPERGSKPGGKANDQVMMRWNLDNQPHWEGRIIDVRGYGQ